MKARYIKTLIAVLSVMMLSLTGCNQNTNMSQTSNENNSMEIQKAVAIIHPLNNSGVSGIVYFNKLNKGIEIIADINGLSQGKHGFHIHEYGDLRNDDGTSAGGHFNPDDKPHGAPNAIESHVGDLGNIIALNKTTAHFDLIDTVISFSGPHSIIGRSLIIHQGEDDLKSQPSGDAGQRIGGGVIGIANDKL